MARASANMRHALPSLEEAQQRLQSHRSASCSGQAPPTADREQPAVMDWREVVEGLHRLHHQAPLSGHQMLTDTFGCAWLQARWCGVAKGYGLSSGHM
jgi:hypothetical protein